MIDIHSLDPAGFFSEYIASKSIDNALKGIQLAISKLKKDDQKIIFEEFDSKRCIEYISKHITDNISWATNVSFKDLTRAKNINEIFIAIDLFVQPLRNRIDTSNLPNKINVNNLLFDSEENIIILGQPGAGKTTSVKKIFLDLVFDRGINNSIYAFPIILRLKELKYENDDFNLILLKSVLNTVGIFYNLDPKPDILSQERIITTLFKEFVERLDVLLIFDGLDEITDTSVREEVIRNLRLITFSLFNSRFILTSRTSDYNVHIDQTSVYEISPLNESQIHSFIIKWITNPVDAQVLFDNVKKSPYWDTTIRPLTLAHLCALFERNKEIPEKPKTIYNKIIHLLLEEWSIQSGVVRKSHYARFEPERKMEFLSRFAYELVINYNRITFDSEILKHIYNQICEDYGLEKSECLNVVREIESHNGLIIQISNSDFEFTHKSLLEFLVADYIVKLPILLNDPELLKSIPNELSIAIAISSNSNLLFYTLFHDRLKEKCLEPQFLLVFLSRLLIEKPDFNSDAFLAITISYLIEIISEKIKPLIDRRDMELDKSGGLKSEESFSQEINYYSECLDLIMTFINNNTFKASVKELRKHYNFSKLELKPNSPKAYMLKWGNVHLLASITPSIKSRNVQIEIPKHLYLIGKFYSFS